MCDVPSLAYKIKALNGHDLGTWKGTIWMHEYTEMFAISKICLLLNCLFFIIVRMRFAWINYLNKYSMNLNCNFVVSWNVVFSLTLVWYIRWYPLLKFFQEIVFWRGLTTGVEALSQNFVLRMHNSFESQNVHGISKHDVISMQTQQ